MKLDNFSIFDIIDIISQKTIVKSLKSLKVVIYAKLLQLLFNMNKSGIKCDDTKSTTTVALL